MPKSVVDFTYLSPRNAQYRCLDVTVANGAVFVALDLSDAERDEAVGVLYLHRHSDTGRCYIGVTEQKAIDRWFAGAAYTRNRQFGSALRKFGWEAFESFILAFADSRDDLNHAEVLAIAAAGGHRSRHTYNLSPGGDTIAENDVPVEAVNLRSGAVKRFKSSSSAARFLGIKNPDSVAAVVRKERTSVGDWWFRRLDDGTAKPPSIWGEPLRKRRIEEVFGTRLVAVNYNTRERLEFQSASAAARHLGLFQTSISAVLRAEQSSAGGWAFFKHGENESLPSLFGASLTRAKRDRTVFATNVVTKESRAFRNCTVADRELGLAAGSASAVATCARTTAGGWHFSFTPDTAPPSVVSHALVSRSRSKPVVATCCQTGQTKHFPSAKAASLHLGMSEAAISKVLSGQLGAVKGWRFARPDATNIELPPARSGKPERQDKE
jgi:hypothetical protein